MGNIRNFSSTGTWGIDSKGSYTWSSSTADGHGGHAAEHRAEMQEIALSTVYERAPQIAAEIYNNAVSRLIGAITYDINTAVNIAFDSGEEIFSSSAARKAVSDAIVKQISARLEDYYTIQL